jgi:hypothetical protein
MSFCGYRDDINTTMTMQIRNVPELVVPLAGREWKGSGLSLQEPLC